MRKTYCDECGKEVGKSFRAEIHLRFDNYNSNGVVFRSDHLSQDLCRDCFLKVRKSRKWLGE